MNIIVLFSPHITSRSDRGFRHALVPGDDRTLCGKDLEGWFGDIGKVWVPFEKGKIGCKTCIRVHEKRSRA